MWFSCNSMAPSWGVGESGTESMFSLVCSVSFGLLSLQKTIPPRITILEMEQTFQRVFGSLRTLILTTWRCEVISNILLN